MRKNCSQVILENFFEPCILYLLKKKESYGYELIGDLNSKCSCNVNAGNLYRTMKRLGDSDYVTKKIIPGKIGPDRVVYSITQKGELYLKQWIVNLEQQNKIITNFIKNYKKL